MKVPIDHEEYLVDLRLNLDLVTDNHVLSYQENGTTVLYKLHKEVSDTAYFIDVAKVSFCKQTV